MVIRQSINKDEELDRILTIFRSGSLMCKSALYTLLYAIATFLLVIVHIMTSLINFAIGVLTCMYGLVCMLRLLLTLCQEIAAMGPQSAMIGYGRKF